MQNKRMILIIAVLVLVIGAAAFVAGRMLNGNVSPLGMFGIGGKGDVMTVRVNLIPAKELPETRADVVGQFVKRQDNTIFVSSIPMKSGGGGMVVQKSDGEVIAGSPADLEDGPQVEIVVTNETTIYRETTEPAGPPSGKEENLQQTVEESTLDELNSQSMVMVWGRKSGDRIIADVLFYSNPVMFKRPAP